MGQLTFMNPELLWHLLIVPILLFRYYSNRSKVQTQGFQVSFADKLPIQTNYFNPNLLTLALRTTAIILLILAISRPVKKEHIISYLPKQQVSIMLAIDVSKSMLAQDLYPNRLEALKKIAADFIDQRKRDRVGLVLYAGESYTACPLTDDHLLLKGLLNDAGSMYLPDGTAIGMGLLSAINRLRRSNTDGKVIVILTDGENNAGTVSPIKAAEIAKKHKIKIYTVGIGTNGMANYPVKTVDGKEEIIQVPVSIDENTLTAVAATTNGRYFRARNNNELDLIYKEISKAETVEPQSEMHEQLNEFFLPFAFSALAIVFAEITFKYLFFKQLA